MSHTLGPPAPLSPLATAFGLASALIVLFVVCALVQVVVPGLPATHAWVGLFTAEQTLSVRAWGEGIFYSAVFGALAGSVFVAVYNAVPRRAD